MPVIGIFSGTFCNQETFVRELQKRTEYELVADSDIVKKASDLCSISENKIERAFSAKTSVFNNFTHEKERSVAHMKLAVAQTLKEGKLIFSGFSSLLIPKKNQSCAPYLLDCRSELQKRNGRRADAVLPEGRHGTHPETG